MRMVATSVRCAFSLAPSAEPAADEAGVRTGRRRSTARRWCTRGAQSAWASRLSALPTTNRLCFARVRATFCRRRSARKPMRPRPPPLPWAPPTPAPGVRTAEKRTSSASRPWKPSTVDTATAARSQPAYRSYSDAESVSSWRLIRLVRISSQTARSRLEMCSTCALYGLRIASGTIAAADPNDDKDSDESDDGEEEDEDEDEEDDACGARVEQEAMRSRRKALATSATSLASPTLSNDVPCRLSRYSTTEAPPSRLLLLLLLLLLPPQLEWNGVGWLVSRKSRGGKRACGGTTAKQGGGAAAAADDDDDV